MQAIICKYLPATNTRGARIKASCERGSLIRPYDYDVDMGQACANVVEALCAQFDTEDAEKYGSKLGAHSWSRPKASGQLPSGEWVFCFIPASVSNALKLIMEAEGMQAGERNGAVMGKISLAIDAARDAMRVFTNP
jgi:hypothetical protein